VCSNANAAAAAIATKARWDAAQLIAAEKENAKATATAHGGGFDWAAAIADAVEREKANGKAGIPVTEVVDLTEDTDEDDDDDISDVDSSDYSSSSGYEESEDGHSESDSEVIPCSQPKVVVMAAGGTQGSMLADSGLEYGELESNNQ